MAKKKVFVARNLKDCYQIYHSDQEKPKRKSKFFYRDNFVLEKENSIPPFFPVDFRNQESADSWFQESTDKNGVIEFSLIINRAPHGAGLFALLLQVLVPRGIPYRARTIHFYSRS